MDATSLYNRASSVLQSLDDVCQSTSVQELRNHAPLIIQSFKELKVIEKSFRHEINLMKESRSEDFKRFQEVAPGMMQNLKSILDHIFQLQQEVRSLSGRMEEDPTAQTVIEYTERHIQQLLDIFQKLSFNLLNC